MQKHLAIFSFWVLVAGLLGAGRVLAHGETAPAGALHLPTQIGLPQAGSGHDAGGGHGGESEKRHQASAGSALSANFDVALSPPPPYEARAAQSLRFVVSEKAAGRQIRNFEKTHSKYLHLIIVSSDLTEFYHKHPQLQADGAFGLERFAFPRESSYTLFFDFKPVGASGVLVRKEVAVGRGVRTAPHLEPSRWPVLAEEVRLDLKITPEMLTVGQDAQLAFHLSDRRTGTPVADVEPYLAAPAHLVMLSEASLAYVHVHPDREISDDSRNSAERFGPEIVFHAAFPEAGRYKGWLQFQRRGEISTIPFVVSAERGRGLGRHEVAELVHETQQLEEGRAVVRFVALAISILGLVMLFWPRRPQPVAPSSGAAPPPASPVS